MLTAPELSMSSAGLDEPGSLPAGGGGERTRGLISFASASGYRWVQLDGTLAGVRARELDRSGRRDLGATLRRAEVGLSGIDLWIPPAHFEDRATSDRATGATVQALELAGELARLADAGHALVAVELGAQTPDDVRAALGAAAMGAGALLVDCAAGAIERSTEGIVVGIDPASVLAGGQSPAKLVTEASTAGALGQVRLSDWSGASRCRAGASDGRLELTALFGAVVAASVVSPVVVDLRGVSSWRQDASAVREAWEQAPFG